MYEIVEFMQWYFIINSGNKRYAKKTINAIGRMLAIMML